MYHPKFIKQLNSFHWHSAGEVSVASGWQRDKWQHEGTAWMSVMEKVRGHQIAPGATWGSGIKQEGLFHGH